MIDIEKIKEYTGADEAFIATLFTKFLGHLDDDLTELKTQTEKENWKALRERTHAMLSSARIFHLNAIITLSMQIEDMVDSNSVETIDSHAKRLIQLYEQLRAEMEQWLAKM